MGWFIKGNVKHGKFEIRILKMRDTMEIWNKIKGVS